MTRTPIQITQADFYQALMTLLKTGSEEPETRSGREDASQARAETRETRS